MATQVISSDYFRLQWINTILTAYQKNGTQLIGRYTRGLVNFYVSEVLIPCSVASIPTGSTINSVTTVINVVSASGSLAGSPSQTINIKKQDNGTWSDNFTTEPNYSAPNPPFDAAREWPSALSSVGGITSSTNGNVTIPSSAGLVSLVQGWVNGTGTAHDGLILDSLMSFYNWYAAIDSAVVTVDYTAPAAANKFLLMF